MADLLSDFLDNPAGETFLPLRVAILADPEYDLFSSGLTQIQDCVERNAPDAALAMVPMMMPNWLLSPQMHAVIQWAATSTGDTARARSEELFQIACLRGLTESGDGTEAAPYAVLHVADEYALAAHHGKAAVSQRREVHDGRVCDVLTCDDDSELWYDVTAPLAAMATR